MFTLLLDKQTALLGKHDWQAKTKGNMMLATKLGPVLTIAKPKAKLWVNVDTLDLVQPSLTSD